MFTLFLSILGAENPFSLYEFIPGNWTSVKHRASMLIDLDDEIVSETNTSKYYTGFFNNSKLTIEVTSPTTMNVQYGKIKTHLNLTLVRDWITHADTILENGLHLSFSTFAQINCEIEIADKETGEIHSIGLRKIEKVEYKLHDFLIPTGIAIAIIFVLKYFLHISFF
ncbi:hypothetical protein TVAG_035140 [Trichomonas vaginalis G3]|uniref:Uncharacterized protein n=1 Tax=Trichomonas vaginalis (strain ATCC PRA-98 / G3) TaxID=412133 RepID=A2DAI8_TRIV3|nr:hypothetical protein TVAGG3_0811170 [Trichomonas vaginalis G3]EAY22491.1 hypothetical protein TVAG_035140 [Trichomonas vaginalis G3]KAI5497216.1 hypothetical protein TVAGG3_0811170 [Trichomonas vaginalis G3]|eukprot:XP_001583477.1 hypothetical protein [Trichomonas vaginalis G3]